MKEEAEATDYERQLGGGSCEAFEQALCARDLYRLLDGFRATAAAQLEESVAGEAGAGAVVVSNKSHGRPGEGDDDAGEAVPITLRDPKVGAGSPHDPIVVPPTAGHSNCCGERHPVDHS